MSELCLRFFFFQFLYGNGRAGGAGEAPGNAVAIVLDEPRQNNAAPRRISRSFGKPSGETTFIRDRAERIRKKVRQKVRQKAPL